MNKDPLIKYIQSSIQMPREKALAIADQLELLEVPKNELLLKENKTSQRTYILEGGFARSFTLDNNGEEVTTNIFSPFCFINDMFAFFSQKPATESFQTLTECRLWTMSFEKVEENFHNSPEFREFGRMILVTSYSTLKSRMLGMIKDTAENRYVKLMDQHPEIVQNVSLKIIASFLGITDTSLSRIRKDLSNKI